MRASRQYLVSPEFQTKVKSVKPRNKRHVGDIESVLYLEGVVWGRTKCPLMASKASLPSCLNADFYLQALHIDYARKKIELLVFAHQKFVLIDI